MSHATALRIDPVHVSPTYGEFDLVAGTLIPNTNYEIVREIGQGAMGVVFEARNVQIHRRVALKVLMARLVQYPMAMEALRAEARASAAIGNANIVDVYDFITLPDGRTAIAMELLDGEPLDQVALDGPMHPSRLIGILRQACRALQAAHERDLVHRDIKPDNIMLVSRDGRCDFTKLVDFGIASAKGTTSRRPIGTPAYMSPEAILNVPIDARADIYSLGCTAYELAVGHLPFDFEELEEMFSAHLHERPVPPNQTGAKVPKPLSAVIMRCIAKQRDDRYEDMRDLEAALCEAQIELDLQTSWDDLPVPAVEPERRARILAAMPGAVAGRQRNRLGWLAGAAGLVVAAASFATLYLRSPEVTQQASLLAPAIEETDAAEAAAFQARAAAARALYVYPLVDEPETPTAYRIVLGLEQQGGPVASNTSQQLRQEFGETLSRLGDDYWESPGGRPFARDYYAQALIFNETNEMAAERSGLTAGERAELRAKASEGSFSRSELIAAEPLSVLVEPDPVERTKKLRRVRKKRRHVRPATVEAALDDLELPPPAAPSGVASPEPPESPEPANGDAPPEPPEAIPKRGAGDMSKAMDSVAKAEIALAAGQTAEAERHYNRALAAKPRHFAALVGLGDLYFDQANYHDAAKFRALAVRKSPNNTGAHLKLGDAYFKVARYPAALAAYERAKELGSARATERIRKVRAKTAG